MNAHTSYDHAISYALNTIKSLFIINGGALIALLLISGTIIGKDTHIGHANMSFVIYLAYYAIYFVFGLALAVLSGIFGHMAHARKAFTGEIRYNPSQAWGIICAFLSLVAFMIGCVSCLSVFDCL